MTPKKPSPLAPSARQIIDSGQSMLGPNLLPVEYGRIVTSSEALAAATPPVSQITLRMTIVWDNDVETLDLERVLESMRETGAAFVLSVQQVN